LHGGYDRVGILVKGRVCMSVREDLNQSAEIQVKMLQKEIELLKKELKLQLDMRETELNDYSKLEKKYGELEKRYNSIRNSFLGKVTVKYWGLRKKLKK
jgi:predicted nuclease with TOPRIM domain